MKGKIRVYCRARPMFKGEKGDPALSFPDPYTIELPAPKNTGGVKSFQFDSCFPSDVSQETIFDESKSLVQSAVDGYNVCIFAYGQTGSGKTYTMTGGGSEGSEGIAPRAMDELFRLIDEGRNANTYSFDVKCYMMELYLDVLWDVLLPAKQEASRLDIKKDGRGVVSVAGITTVPANSAQDLLTIFTRGLQQRHTSATNMNAESSRSHLIFTILIETCNTQTTVRTLGKLSLVDLAGSERVGKSGATDQTLKEAQSINKSLSALGDVISALSSGQDHIPSRNHKLTMLMSDSIGGNAKTLMFVNVSPTSYNVDETINSLQYAQRVKTITNNAQTTVESKEIQRLKAIIADLKGGSADAV
mmetsp:Transcript_805/g.1310  ORF Transcript_805/g.1310 Transcript_805/m.1310 type:complete len:360 (+) Transcript_805:515-1594(+)